MIYLDYQATTPLAPEVAAAMRPWIEEKFANPHSASRWGSEAAAAVEVARDQVERAIGLGGGRFAFTSGATEAINWAIKGTFERSERRKLVTVATEHAAVLDSAEWLEGTGVEVVRLAVGPDGLIDLEAAKAAIDENTALVAVMLVNNEIGVIQPIAEVARIAHERGALMLCDAVQGFGRMATPDGPDLVAVSGHKIHGPKGVGGLWMRGGAEPAPLLHGGGQELGLRSGTQAPALCAGLGEAARLAVERREADAAHVAKLAHLALAALGHGWTVNGSPEHRYAGNLNLRRERLDSARLIADLRNIAFSVGSACASGSGRPSHVLRALGLSDQQARSSIRLGFGRYTGEDELASACRRIDDAARSQEGLAA
ncbi:cysteine desulfurase family protein [Sphingomonas sp.]|uniref:cysteine desulfurase family protein n=1 Tax=Sphingomonas sp. TaxID=28214 RepID=UPI00179951F9|nr:cysteine desulfurase family protein [Sphingomonas sp.]MBA3510603.1 cysteine desulfurase [Sphingomonas sp.]